MKIFARAELVRATLTREEPALLCEGSWTPTEVSPSRWSLDDAIDARCAWVDREAARLAEQAACSRPESTGGLYAWLNALALRYELVKLVRVIAFFEQCYRPRRREPIEIHLERDRDEPYALLFRELSRSHRLPRVERWHAARRASSLTFPANRRWRRAVARLAQAREAKLVSPDALGQRVVLCGNPRILDPVCEELLRRRARIWWLYDRFAVRSFARWRMRGVRQIICETNLGRANCFAELKLEARLACRGIDLGAAVERWLIDRAGTHGARQTRLLAEVERQLRAIQPDAIVCDEDATPLPRAAMHVTRGFGTQSFVVQHGAPCIRFGFTPPATDRLLAWGESSARQLERWGVDRERITLCGAPFREKHEAPLTSPPQAPDTSREGEHQEAATPTKAHIVLLATVPPNDSRPDAVEYHLTRGTHAAMIEAACRAVASIPNARLTVKLHPRTRDERELTQVVSRYPNLDVRIVRHGHLTRLVRGAACVLSCASSAGVEAAAYGVPVIQLLPGGSSDLLRADEWGFVGTARTEAELALLLSAALGGARQRATENAFAASGREAARRVVETVLAPLSERTELAEDETPAGALTLAGASTWLSS